MKKLNRLSPKLQKVNPAASAKAKGERLKRIRHLANLSREDFCENGTINLATLISWEVGRFGGLSLKGAKRVIERVEKEGVFCTSEWLLYEIGAGPTISTDYTKISQQPSRVRVKEDENSYLDEKAIIIKELMFFRNLNKYTMDFIIDDDGMLPHYRIGDFVAGTKYSKNNMKDLIGLDCIVQTKAGRILIRNLQNGPRPHSFNLVCTNLQTSVKDAIIYDIELANIAPILWHRRRAPFSEK